MVTIWSSHQRCPSCDWAGATRSHIGVVVCGGGYIATAVVLALLESTEVLEISSVITWPTATLALLWYYGIPKLLWHYNACRACGNRMAVDLVAGRLPT